MKPGRVMRRTGTFTLLAVFLYLHPAGLDNRAEARDAVPEYRGRVVRVADGDSLTLLVNNREVEIRLAWIDAPEHDQPYGERAKRLLSGLVDGKYVLARVVATDDYGRSVARVYADNLYVNAEMIRRGAAWVYRQYAKEELLYGLEQEARQAGRGIWGLPGSEQVPPWVWRHGKR